MTLSGITWEAGGTTDTALLPFLPDELRQLIEHSGGFILHNGAIHFRGCTLNPEWNSLRKICWGDQSLTTLYTSIDPDDIPFAQDQFGDQYLLRGSRVFRLNAETGDLVAIAKCLTEFLDGINDDIETYLNITLGHPLEPGSGFLAYPPFCVAESHGKSPSSKEVPFDELLQFHADLAHQIRSLPDGASISFEMTD